MSSQYFDEKDLFMGPKVTQYGSHMVMTHVQKETKQKFWNIDTQFRDDYDICFNSVQQYNFSLPQPINDVKSITVKNVELPITFYNISASLGNNTMKITDTTNTIYYYIVIPDGNYDTSMSLITAINGELSKLDTDDIYISNNIIFSIVNGYASFSTKTNSGNYRYTFDFAITTNFKTSTYTTTQYADFDKYSIKSKLGWLLGFRNINYIKPSDNDIDFVSEQLLDLNRIHYVYLVVDEFSSNSPNSFISPFSTSILNKNILAKISLDHQKYQFGSLLIANYSDGHLQSDKRIYSGKINLQRLKVQLVNEYGISINLNGSDFSFCLKIEYE